MIGYRYIDSHALNCPSQAEKSIRTLASYLIAPAKNEQEKSRVIFRWITSNIAYDIDGYQTNNYGDMRPSGVLKNRHAVCDGYCALFKALGEEAGLEVVKINGHAKGHGYTVGDRFNGPAVHAWNAVKINKRWSLVDTTWGAGYVKNGKFVRHFEEYYFMSLANQFIYSHFPENSKWQLLSQSISIQQFEKLVHLKPVFFKSNLALDSHVNCIIKTDNHVIITLTTPDNISLTARLKQNSHELDKSLTFIQKEPGRCKIYAVLPGPRNYILSVFTKRIDETGSYDWALDYLIEASKGVQPDVRFPETYSLFYEKGIYLYSPTTKYLKTGSTQTFKLWVPRANNVVVIIDGKWFPLQKQDKFFVGAINISSSNVSIFAQFPGHNQYIGLLQYNSVV